MPRFHPLSLALHRSRLAAQRGVAAVEFALLLVPMLLLAFGVTEYGRAVYQYNTLVKSTRSAVRMLSQHDPATTGYDGWMDKAKNLAVCGKNDCVDMPSLAPGLTTANVKICDRLHTTGCDGNTYENVNTMDLGEINLVEIRITDYEFTFLGLPLVFSPDAASFGPIVAVMRQNG